MGGKESSPEFREQVSQHILKILSQEQQGADIQKLRVRLNKLIDAEEIDSGQLALGIFVAGGGGGVLNHILKDMEKKGTINIGDAVRATYSHQKVKPYRITEKGREELAGITSKIPIRTKGR